MSEYNIGYIVGLVVGLILVLVLLKFIKKDKSTIRCKYDERQELIRGRGFKYGFYTLLIYYALDMGFGEVLEMYVDRAVISFTGIGIGILVYVVYAIWNEGYIALNENPKKVMITFAVLALVNIVLGLTNIGHEGLFENGVISFRMVNLLCGIVLLIILAVLFVKNICDKKSDER